MPLPFSFPNPTRRVFIVREHLCRGLRIPFPEKAGPGCQMVTGNCLDSVAPSRRSSLENLTQAMLSWPFVRIRGTKDL
jgi:hypothetical protein